MRQTAGGELVVERKLPPEAAADVAESEQRKSAGASERLKVIKVGF